MSDGQPSYGSQEDSADEQSTAHLLEPIDASQCQDGAGTTKNGSRTSTTDNSRLPRISANTSSADPSSRLRKCDSKERKRERNREWMRRARLLKRAEQQDTQATIAALELQRDQLMRERNLDAAALDDLLGQRHDAYHKMTTYRQLNSNYTRTEQTLGALREENCTLREELRRRRVAAGAIGDLVQELRLSESPSPRYELRNCGSELDWFHEIDALYKPIAPDQTLVLVRESYAEIMQYVGVAEKCLPSAHQVFGWNDRRFLEGSWSNFMFDKVFPHKHVFELSEKTWKLSTDGVRMRVLQPQAQRMKVLQELNANTLVVARQSYFPQQDVHLCSVYVLFRIATPEGGVVIGTRTIEPYDKRAMVKFHSSGRYLFTKLVYTFQFTPWILADPEPMYPDFQVIPNIVGCHVNFGGRVDNVRSIHAANCLMDAVLAMLRWEAHCVAPILTLES